jgi:hypothetical protein
VENNKARLDLRAGWQAGEGEQAPVGAALLSENAPAQKRPRLAALRRATFCLCFSSRLRQSSPRTKKTLFSISLNSILGIANTLQFAAYLQNTIQLSI